MLLMEYAMKTLPVILAIMMLAGCSSTGMSGGGYGMSGSDSSIQQWNKDHHVDPSDTYFGG